MRFEDEVFVREDKYSLGQDTEVRQMYLSIPVQNSKIQYEEYYRISRAMYEEFKQNPIAAKKFADDCRKRQHDDRLILAPGTERGEPV